MLYSIYIGNMLEKEDGSWINSSSFTAIDMCKVKTKTLLQLDLKDILPLVPLTQDGQDHNAIDYVIIM